MSVFTESVVFDLIASVTTIFLGLYLYVQWKYTYWAKIGLPTPKPSFLLGNSAPMLKNEKMFAEFFRDFYFYFKRNGFKHGGIYTFLNPVYMPVDPVIIKQIMQNDFQHFVNHGVVIDENNDPLSAHLFNMEDEKWRQMRVKLTPTFTSGKIKMMFQTVVDCTVGLQEIIQEAANSKTSVNIKDVLARFTTDIISSVAFGLDCNSLKNPETEFRKYGKKIFETDRIERLKMTSLNFLPKSVSRALGIKRTKNDVENFFMKAISDTVAYREKNNVYRKDFLHLLIQLKNRGVVTDDEKITNDDKLSKNALTMKELAAQAFVFFIAGFETSSTTMTFALLELARNPEIQEKVRNEINTVLEKHNGELSYAAVMEMNYLEKVINETLRKHPAVPIIIRKCTKDYTIPNTTITLKKGMGVLISNFGLQTDPEYYPEPEKFDPERFSEENKKTRPDFTWLPFGEGPRLCIGMRFGIIQSKVGLIALLKSYKITLNQKTQIPIKFDKDSLVLSVEGGVWLDVQKIN